jgi:hypothetical protein
VRTNLKSTIEVKFGSQIAFSKPACIHPVRLSKIVRGWIEPTPVERERLTELLKVDAIWLFQIFTIPNATLASEESADATFLSTLAAQIDNAIEAVKTTAEPEKL